jgi:protein-tyrosine phosphatase
MLKVLLQRLSERRNKSIVKRYKFAAASETEAIAFGAARPPYNDKKVAQWIEFMHDRNIQRICCLLSLTQLNHYSNLLEIYRQHFGPSQVYWAPIEDFQLVDYETLTQKILPFLSMANQQNEKVVVHCSGGVGRTGQVLAAWLVYERGFSPQEAITAVKQTGRNPHEAAIVAFLKGQNPFKVISQFQVLLEHCQKCENVHPSN